MRRQPSPHLLLPRRMAGSSLSINKIARMFTSEKSWRREDLLLAEMMRRFAIANLQR